MKILITIMFVLFIIILIIFIKILYFYLINLIIFYKNFRKENKLILPHNKYIYFNHKNFSGIGIIYNKGDDKNPIYFAACIYDDRSIQHIKLNELDNYKFIDKK